LHRVGVDALAFGAQPAFVVAVQEGSRRHHFRKRQRSAATTRDPAHADIRNARHRREHRPAIQAQASQREGRVFKNA
jgi:hypothetical protein